jgi:hypothetical protein
VHLSPSSTSAIISFVGVGFSSPKRFASARGPTPDAVRLHLERLLAQQHSLTHRVRPRRRHQQTDWLGRLPSAHRAVIEDKLVEIHRHLRLDLERENVLELPPRAGGQLQPMHEDPLPVQRDGHRLRVWQ